jgi:transposase, IS5 family
MRGQPGFFDIDDRLKRLSDLGDQLETFRSAVDFELFRPELNAALSYTDRTVGGRPPFDPVLMFKILVIQATNNLSDERAEFLIIMTGCRLCGSWAWGWRIVFRMPARSGCSGRS